MNQVAPGLRFVWNHMPEVLESNCMKLINPPLPPPLENASVCASFLTDDINGNPRTLPLDWYFDNVIEREPNQDEAYLQGQGDINYFASFCAITALVSSYKQNPS